MHLNYKTSQYKGKTYKSYSIAESCIEDGKVKKRIIWPVGKPADNQAKQINLLCKMLSDPSKVITSIDVVVAQEKKSFLGLALKSALWDQWELSTAFRDYMTNSDILMYMVAKILTINKSIFPCSHYSIPQWAQKTALPEIMDQSIINLNADNIYI